jgi:iron complex outermembrane receptor protein
MKRHLRIVLSLGVSGLAAGALAGEAHAQEASAQAPAAGQTAASDAEIVVTARRREESLTDVPVAITYVSGEALANAGVVNTQDLVRVAPGLVTSASSTRGYDHLGISIRAQRNGEAAITSDPSVGIYFAEVPQNAPQGLNQGLYDLGSVQVLRGPQGTLFGRNATGGAVLFEPHMPDPDFGGYLNAALGSYDYRDLEGALNLPVSDQLRVRIAGRYTHRDGYMTDVSSGRRYNDINQWGARAIVDWRPSSTIRSTTIGTYNGRDRTGDIYRLALLSPLASTALVDALAATQQLGPYETTSPIGQPGNPITEPGSRGDVWSIQNTTSIELGGSGFFADLRAKNIIGYRDVHDVTVSIPSGSYVPTQDQIITDDINEFSEELQLSATAGRLNWLVGLYYFRTTGSEILSQYNNGIAREQVTQNDVRNSNFSVFAHVDYDLADLLDGLSVSLGGRWNNDQREVIRRSRVQNAVGSPLYTCSLPPATVGENSAELCNVPFEASYEEPTWEASLNWKFQPGSLLYASYRRGYRTGGFSPSRPTNLADAGRTFEPETLDAFEVGLKHRFRSGVVSGLFTLAAFYYDYRDIQRRTTVLISPGATTTLTFNAARAHITGAEAELHLRLFDRLSFDANYAYVNPVYNRFFDTVVVGGVDYQQDVSDSIFNEVSKHQLYAALTYDIPLGPRVGDLALTANYSYRSSFSTFNEINTANCTTPAGTTYAPCYNRAGIIPGNSVVNARVDWTNVLNSGLDVGVFVNNVFDEYYQINAVNVLSSLGFFATGIGAPRTWGVQVRAHF